MWGKTNGFTEIFKLKKMLEDAAIPFEFKDRMDEMPILKESKNLEFFQIEYPQSYQTNPQNCAISVVQGFFSHGRNQDLLEIMGLLTDEEKENVVCGFLTAENVFERIQKHYEEIYAKK